MFQVVVSVDAGRNELRLNVKYSICLNASSYFSRIVFKKIIDGHIDSAKFELRSI